MFTHHIMTLGILTTSYPSPINNTSKKHINNTRHTYKCIHYILNNIHQHATSMTDGNTMLIVYNLTTIQTDGGTVTRSAVDIRTVTYITTEELTVV